MPPSLKKLKSFFKQEVKQISLPKFAVRKAGPTVAREALARTLARGKGLAPSLLSTRASMSPLQKKQHDIRVRGEVTLEAYKAKDKAVYDASKAARKTAQQVGKERLAAIKAKTPHPRSSYKGQAAEQRKLRTQHGDFTGNLPVNSFTGHVPAESIAEMRKQKAGQSYYAKTSAGERVLIKGVATPAARMEKKR